MPVSETSDSSSPALDGVSFTLCHPRAALTVTVLMAMAFLLVSTTAGKQRVRNSGENQHHEHDGDSDSHVLGHAEDGAVRRRIAAARAATAAGRRCRRAACR